MGPSYHVSETLLDVDVLSSHLGKRQRQLDVAKVFQCSDGSLKNKLILLL